MKRFVGRHKEIEAIRERLKADSSFVLLYGQRRCGKTYLLQHVLADNPNCLFYTADETTSPMLLDRFVAQAVENGMLPESLEIGARSTWGTALTLILQQAMMDQRPVVLVLDECQYLLEREPALASVLQRLWDQYARRFPLHIVLCGSALTTMARLGDSSQPLHGRFDLKLHLRPFSYLDAARFVPDWSAADQLRLYGIFGGLARHLAYIAPEEDLAANTCHAILDPLAALHFAPQDILRAERLSAPADAEAVLTALALGENRFNAVAARTGLSAPRLDYVLRELNALDVVDREVRFGDKAGSKFVKHRCKDPFMSFWFRFVRNNRNALMSLSPRVVFDERIRPHLDQHMGPVFESTVKQALLAGLLTEGFGPVDELGSFWSRDGKTEIDIVARSGSRILYVECKWRVDSVVRQTALHQLQEHAHRASLNTQDSVYCIAAAGPFSDGLRTVSETDGVILLGLEDLLSPDLVF